MTESNTYNFQYYTQNQPIDYGTNQIQSGPEIVSSTYLQGVSATLQTSPGLGETTAENVDYLNQNNFDTNAIFGETIQKISEIPYGQNFQGITSTTTNNIIDGNTLFLDNNALISNTTTQEVQGTTIDTNSYFNNTNFDTNAIFFPETTTITTTTTTNENTYFTQPQEIQGTTTFGETQILPSIDSNTYYGTTQYNYYQPQTQNEYTTSYQTSNNIDLNYNNFGTTNIELGNIYTVETIPITQNETTTTTTTNTYIEPTNYDMANSQIYKTSEVPTTNTTTIENAFNFSFKSQIREKDKSGIINNFKVYDDKKSKINYNNKTEIKINKEPNINKLNINLSNYKMINKNGNNKNFKKVRLIYKNNNNDSINLFNCDFVRENKDKCKLKYNGKEIELKEYISCKNKEDKEIKIILEIFKNVTHINYMFFNCHTLISVQGISNLISSETTDISCMFLYCSSLISLPDIGKLDISKVTNMNKMFYECKSLISLPDLSEWNTSNVNDMSNMFHGCNSLKSLSGISKWDTKNVTNMCEMFRECKSLKNLPDISNWNMSKVINMSEMFRECESLISLPDLSKWKLNELKKIERIFLDCSSLKSLPDISNWNLSKVQSLFSIFKNCSSLISLPDISKWDASKVKSIYSMFAGCKLLSSIPDISKWNITCIKEMSLLFSDCSSLVTIPDVFKFKGDDITISDIFKNCHSLISLPDIKDKSKYRTEKLCFNENKIFSNCFSLICPLPNFIKHHDKEFYEGSEWSQLFGYKGEYVTKIWYTFE